MNKGFAKLGFIKRMLSPTVAQVEDIGGEVQESIVSPKGIYASPSDTDAIIIPIMKGETQTAVMAIQDFVGFLQAGDVILTDNNSHIHFKYENGELHVKAKKIVFDIDDEVTFNTKKCTMNIAEAMEILSASFTHNGIDVGNSHAHDGVTAGNANTGTPI